MRETILFALVFYYKNQEKWRKIVCFVSGVCVCVRERKRERVMYECTSYELWF